MKIGITPRFENSLFGDPWFSFEVNLCNFIKKWQSDLEIELIVPHNVSKVSELEYLVLSGGVTPGENLERDSFEIEALDTAIRENVKVLGICRGAQLLVKYFDGSVVETRPHINQLRPLDGVVGILGACFHNFSIHDLPNNFEFLARDSNDKSVEIFFDWNKNLLGVMSHPERKADSIKDFLRVMEFIKWA